MVIAAGLGCRRGCAAGEIVDLLRMALAEAGLAEEELSTLVAPAFKQEEAGLSEAALRLGVPLLLVPEAALEAVQHRVLTRSTRVEAHTGFASIAEAAALVGAGESATLIRPRIATLHATCAIAISED